MPISPKLRSLSWANDNLFNKKAIYKQAYTIFLLKILYIPIFCSNFAAEMCADAYARVRQTDRKSQTAPLIGKCDYCLRAPHKYKICGDPIIIIN